MELTAGIHLGYTGIRIYKKFLECFSKADQERPEKDSLKMKRVKGEQSVQPQSNSFTLIS
jgi:hypothetical protein